ncbi:NAD-binding protein [Amanita rubescens]|nr:NAD-binding protein [Amanita rubescens]
MSAPRRVAIVTGAASGIGKAISIRLASNGFNVALNDLPGSLDKLKEVADLASQHGIDTMLVPGDVSSGADVEKIVDDAVTHFGGLDVMIANAVTTEQWDRIFAVNARGTFLCCKYAVRQMIQQGRGGRIVGASSTAGLRGSPLWPHYSATKFAVRGLTQALGKHGITVNAYAPGKRSDPYKRIAGARTALGYKGQPEDVANVVSFLVSENAGYITSQAVSFLHRGFRKILNVPLF